MSTHVVARSRRVTNRAPRREGALRPVGVGGLALVPLTNTIVPQ